MQLIFHVNAVSSSPSIGVKAYESVNKIINNVQSIDQLTSGSIKDRELYEINIKDALAGNKPIVVVFASPGFCINPVCGPQVEVLQKLKNKYKSQAYFIHVEFYDNPDEMQFDIKKARVSPIVLEWNNEEGIIFKKRIELDNKYLFKITQEVQNNTNQAVDLYPYAQITRNKKPDDLMGFYILHEGFIGVFDEELKESILPKKS